MTHDEILARLDARADGTLAPAELAEVEHHLEGCDSCRAAAVALAGLLAEARALPRSIQPERDLWGGIVPRLRRDGSPIRRGPVSIRPLLLAAALGGILLGGLAAGLWLRAREPSAFAATQARYAEASAALARALAAEPERLAPETQAVVGRSLAIVDQAIAEAEAALARDPGNAVLEQMLVARYEQRLGLLRRATQAGRQES